MSLFSIQVKSQWKEEIEALSRSRSDHATVNMTDINEEEAVLLKPAMFTRKVDFQSDINLTQLFSIRSLVYYTSCSFELMHKFFFKFSR